LAVSTLPSIEHSMTNPKGDASTMVDDLRERVVAAILPNLPKDQFGPEEALAYADKLADIAVAARDADPGYWRGRAEAAEAELAENDGVMKALRRQRDTAEAAIARVRELHQEHEGRCLRCLEPCTCLDDAEQTPEGLWHAWANVCGHGNAEWPCPTIAALDSKDADRD
jgi:hypothetical protein